MKQKSLSFQTIWQSASILLMGVVIGLVLNQWRPDTLPMIGDWSPQSQLALKSGESIVISLDEAIDLFFSDAAVFIDARPLEDYSLGHIEGARSLPWENFEERFPEAANTIPLHAILITYCDGESCGLSHELALALHEKGYKNVRLLVNGWTLWQEANLPIGKGTESSSEK